MVAFDTAAVLAAMASTPSSLGRAASDEPLFAAIAARRTCRERFADQDVPSAIASELGAAAGLQASHLNQPIQLERLRPRVAALLAEGGFAQIALRLGYPRNDLRPAPAAAARGGGQRRLDGG